MFDGKYWFDTVFCTIQPSFDHVFKWIDETLVEELDILLEEQKKLFQDQKVYMEVATKKAHVDRTMTAEKIMAMECGQKKQIQDLQSVMKKGLLTLFVIGTTFMFYQCVQ